LNLSKHKSQFIQSLQTINHKRPDILSKHVSELPVSAEEIATATRKDSTVSRALEFTQHGWPENVSDKDLQPYFQRKLELTVEDNCLLWGRRVVIPRSLRKRIMDELHDGHQGICKTKQLARGFVWWPKLDQDIQDLVRNCTICLSVRKQPAIAPQAWKRWNAYTLTLQNVMVKAS
jgi:hypothetical protein